MYNVDLYHIGAYMYDFTWHLFKSETWRDSCVEYLMEPVSVNVYYCITMVYIRFWSCLSFEEPGIKQVVNICGDMPVGWSSG